MSEEKESPKTQDVSEGQGVPQTPEIAPPSTAPEPPKQVLPPPEVPGHAEKPPEDMGKRLAVLEAERLNAKKKELEDLLVKVDERIGDFKKFVENTEVAGRSLAAPELSDDERQKRELNKALDGTGLSV